MFRGTEYRNLDDKGRIAIPRKFRSLLLDKQGEGRIVVTKSLGKQPRCLEIYSALKWQALEEKLAEMPLFGDKTNALIGSYIHPAQDLALDVQGRVLLPQDLREHMGKGKETVFTGHLNKLLLWSKPEWEKAEAVGAELVAQPGFLDGMGL